jgi:hypothetical protein
MAVVVAVEELAAAAYCEEVEIHWVVAGSAAADVTWGLAVVPSRGTVSTPLAFAYHRRPLAWSWEVAAAIPETRPAGVAPRCASEHRA